MKAVLRKLPRRLLPHDTTRVSIRAHNHELQHSTYHTIDDEQQNEKAKIAHDDSPFGRATINVALPNFGINKKLRVWQKNERDIATNGLVAFGQNVG